MDHLQKASSFLCFLHALSVRIPAALPYHRQNLQDFTGVNNIANYPDVLCVFFLFLLCSRFVF